MATRPKNTELKLYEGEKNANRIRDTPKPARGIMRAPPTLTKAQRQMWDFVVGELQAIGVIALADTGILSRYCVLHERWQLAEQAITEHGALLVSDDGGLRPNPAVGMARDLASELRRIEVEMGMTPASRTKIAVSPTDRGRANIERILKAK